MRHNKKFNHLGRKASHRDAMLSNMATSLIMHKRIVTTLPKAKALRVYVEPIINRAKNATTITEKGTVLAANEVHDRRVVFGKLQSHEAVKELFTTVAKEIGDRPGGYTRILKLGRRQGDDAMMCFIELVDFNKDRVKEAKAADKAPKTRRSRRAGKKSNETAVAEA